MPTLDVFLAEPLLTQVPPLPPFHAGSMKFVYRLDVVRGTSDGDLLEEAFRIFNVQHPRDYQERSLSVGDVITINQSRSYRCAWTGWERLQRPLILLDRETVRLGLSMVLGSLDWSRVLPADLLKRGFDFCPAISCDAVLDELEQHLKQHGHELTDEQRVLVSTFLDQTKAALDQTFEQYVHRLKQSSHPPYRYRRLCILLRELQAVFLRAIWNVHKWFYS